MPDPSDTRVRAATFDWLSEQVALHGDVLTWQTLMEGFVLDDEKISLVSPKGIFKPRMLELPLSIRTVADGPYDDGFADDGLLRYRYRGTDPNHRDNRGLRVAMEQRIPLVYLFGIVEGRYLPTWPVYIVGDNPERLEFSVAVDDAEHIGTAERVLDAYRRECAFCHFRHDELLDAAHIAADATDEGEPRVSNGLALCKLHHAAFDRYFIGLRPDLTLVVRPDILHEADGPTLVHGIQALNGQSIALPRQESNRPDRGLVEARFREFVRKAPRAS